MTKRSLLKTIARVCAIITMVFALIACKSTPRGGEGGENVAEHLPANAAGIITMRTGALLDKSEVKKSVNYQGVMAEIEKELAEDNLPNFIDKPETIGLTYGGAVYFFFIPAEGAKIDAMSGPMGTVGVMGPMMDEGKFTSFLKGLAEENEEEGVSIEEGDGMKFLREDDMIFCWNDTLFLLLGSEGAEVDIKDLAISIMNIEEEESLLATQPSFASLQQQDWDVALWFNMEEVMELAAGMPMGMGAELPLSESMLDDYEDVFATLRLTFKNGSIEFDTDAYGYKGMENFDKAFDERLLDSISGELFGVMTMSFNMEPVYDAIMKQFEAEEMQEALASLEEELKDYGLTLEGVLDIVGGDFIVSASDIRQGESAFSGPEMDFVFGMTINKTEAFDTILAKLVEEEKIEEIESGQGVSVYAIIEPAQPDYSMLTQPPMPVDEAVESGSGEDEAEETEEKRAEPTKFLIIKDDILYLASKAKVDGLKEGKAGDITGALRAFLTEDRYLSGHLDFAPLFALIPAEEAGNDEALSFLKDNFKALKMTAGIKDEGHSASKLSVEMKNTKVNSLKIITDFILEMAAKEIND